MKRFLVIVTFALISFITTNVLAADEYYSNITPEKVMTGSATNNLNNGVWFRVNGLIANANCQWTNYTLFYANSDGTVDPAKVLSILMTAKVSNRTVSIRYNPNATYHDFLGWGYSSCQIEAIVLD